MIYDKGNALIKPYNFQKIRVLFLNYFRSLAILLTVTLSIFFLMSHQLGDRYKVVYTFYPLTNKQVFNNFFSIFDSDKFGINKAIKSSLDSVSSKYMRELIGSDRLKMEIRDGLPYQILFYNLSSEQVKRADLRIKKLLKLTEQELKEWRYSAIMLEINALDSKLKKTRTLLQELNVDSIEPQLKYIVNDHVQVKIFKELLSVKSPKKLFSRVDIETESPSFGFVYYILAFCIGFTAWILRIYIKESDKNNGEKY